MGSYRTPLNIIIDADGSPSGHIAWYNHSTEMSKIRILRPAIKNGRFGVQRMEMLAIYFAISDNLAHVTRIANRQMQKELVVNIRSDSKTTIDQLRGASEVRDAILRRVCTAIIELLKKLPHAITFNHLERSRNIAGFLLEQRRRKQEERDLNYSYDKYYGISRLRGFTNLLTLEYIATA